MGVKGLGRKKTDESEYFSWRDDVKVSCDRLVPSECDDSPLEYNEYVVYDPQQYRFLVDGVWRIDEQQPCISDEYGMVNNAILIDEPNVSSSMASPSNHHPPEQVAWISDADLGVSRLWVSRLLSSRTIYDILPMSSKLFIIDVQLPVKQAFHIMYEEGLLVVPLWDDSRSNITGMLTASDFIIILKEERKVW